MSTSSEYLLELTSYLEDPNSSEMSYRTAFQNYLESIFPKKDGFFIQHDAKVVGGNKPDFIVLKNAVPLLYIEVKKLGEDLNKIEKSDQAARYFGYTNLIISDYAEFRFFRNGQRYDEPIALAKADEKTNTITPVSGASERFERTVRDFVASQKEPITHGGHLAKIMGGRAQRIRDNVIAFLATESAGADELAKMMRFIKENLLATLTSEDFADMYAQTLVYGLFAARYNDDTLDDFSREEARRLVPPTNPFLRHFFDHISGASFPKRLELIVDELCDVFSHANVRALMDQYFKQDALFGEGKESPDPVIHFYEDFLREYDPKKKMEMGVFYTPLPVVRFIVRGIDELLKREFGISKGLADNGTTDIEVEHTDHKGKTKLVTQSIHRVQLLDVATGTGTFLNETVIAIHETLANNQGRWEQYVEDDLLPRLHGFELMMASYTIAHLKLALTLKKTGVNELTTRLGVYLTNTLDTPHDIPLQGSLFGVLDSIAEESRIASRVKKDYPIMVVMGNPPYSGESQNPHYTGNDVYKIEPGGKEKLKEKNSKWINDDYVKFIRFAESMVEKNGEGIVGMITAHGYLDNPTFRGMRWHLRNTFDAIYVLDLHGNSNKKETTPDGGKEENVFDIKTGVAVIFGVKKRKEGTGKKALATVFRADLFGTRAKKFETLDAVSIDRCSWTELPAEVDIWNVEGLGRAEYKKGFSVAELFPENTVGVVTSRDDFVIDSSKAILAHRIEDFLSLAPHEAKLKYHLKENQKWKIEKAQKHTFDERNIVPIAYRPFDTKFVYYHDDFIERSRQKVMKHFVKGKNVGLMVCRQTISSTWEHTSITDKIVDDSFVSNRSRERGYCLSLYLYADSGEKVPNLDHDIVTRIESAVGTTVPEDILDYVYAVLHSPQYREKYQEFLKSDFPRVPYPEDIVGGKDVFWKLVEKGRELRALHLLEGPRVEKPITSFPLSGDNIVEKPVYQNGKVYINKTQYVEGVPETVWNFTIGGYQPAQKYLKDRKGRSLSTAEFENYERMIVALAKTVEVMGEIDALLSNQFR